MLNSDTREILKELSKINNSMVINKTMYGKDEFTSVMFQANLPEDDFPEVCIFDARNFLSSLDLLQDPVITLEDKMILAKDSNAELKFVTSTIESIDAGNISPKIITTTVAAPSCTEFIFDKDLVTKIKNSTAIFKNFDTIYIKKGSDNSVNLMLGTKSTFAKAEHSFSITVDTTEDIGKEFEISIPLDSILKIPIMDYTFMIKYNEKRDTYRVVLINELLTFLISLQG